MKDNTKIKREKIAAWLERIKWLVTIGKGYGQSCRLKNVLYSIYQEGIEEGKRQMKEEMITHLNSK